MDAFGVIEWLFCAALVIGLAAAVVVVVVLALCFDFVDRWND